MSRCNCQLQLNSKVCETSRGAARAPEPTSPPHHWRRKARATGGCAEKMDTGMARSLVGEDSGLGGVGSKSGKMFKLVMASHADRVSQCEGHAATEVSRVSQ